MSKLPIITIPDPVLRKKSAPIERVDDELLRLADDMLETMYDAPGIGLAAPQVGISRRLIVLDVSGDEQPKTPLVMFNPEIVKLGPEMRIYEEGCLSIPGLCVEIVRPKQVLLHGWDLDGNEIEDEWNIQKGTGSSGATAVYRGTKIIEAIALAAARTGGERHLRWAHGARVSLGQPSNRHADRLRRRSAWRRVRSDRDGGRVLHVLVQLQELA